MLSKFLCIAVFYLKVCNYCSLKNFRQHKPNWSEMDVIILIKVFFYIQIYISQSKPLNIFALFY